MTRVLGTRIIGGERFEPVWMKPGFGLKGITRGIPTPEGAQFNPAQSLRNSAEVDNELRTTKAEAVRRANALRSLGIKARVVRVGGGRWMAMKGPRMKRGMKVRAKKGFQGAPWEG